MLLGPGRRPVVKTTCAAALLAVAAAPTAVAAPGGATASPSSTPSIASITCRGGCADSQGVRPGGTVTLRGSALDRASAVVFLGGRGRRDDVRVTVAARSAASLDVKVPARARSGQVAVISTGGAASQASPASIRVVKRAAGPTRAEGAEPVLTPVAGIAQLDAGVATRKAGKAVSGATVAYVSHAAAPVAVRLDVVRMADGLSVFTDERTVDPEARQSIAWDGAATDSGRALDGRYEVRIGTAPAGAETASPQPVGLSAGGAAPQGAAPPPGSARIAAFTFASAVFPVQGAHTYGEGAARFGAGRSGHSHEGQDVMADCGTPVVAARGGVVKQSTYQYAAGNYVVIDDPLTGEAQMYAHFREPAFVGRGDRVEAGEQIGIVGDTGDATACHLHFELWTAPGWYEGGSPIDPYATLKRWEG
jgi:murein DD-endopeptidase MepM/ murein hydrolase activator NlpD